MGTTVPILHRAQGQGLAGGMQGVSVLVGLAEADNSLLPKVNLSSVLALGCGTGWDGQSPAWNRLVWGWE